MQEASAYRTVGRSGGGGFQAWRRRGEDCAGVDFSMLTPEYLRIRFEAGLSYDEYLATATPQQLDNWRAVEQQVSLTDAQQSLLASFTRPMPVLCTSGTWCGDCVVQVPMLAAIEKANPGMISLRLLDRDEHADLAGQITICGGQRVPTVLFLNELFEFVGLLGDRTLSRYRAMAAKELGGACPLPGTPLPADEIAATVQEWVEQFERVQLMLLLSPKLRALHRE